MSVSLDTRRAHRQCKSITSLAHTAQAERTEGSSPDNAALWVSMQGAHLPGRVVASLPGARRHGMFSDRGWRDRIPVLVEKAQDRAYFFPTVTSQQPHHAAQLAV